MGKIGLPQYENNRERGGGGHERGGEFEMPQCARGVTDGCALRRGETGARTTWMGEKGGRGGLYTPTAH